MSHAGGAQDNVVTDAVTQKDVNLPGKGKWVNFEDELAEMTPQAGPAPTVASAQRPLRL